jgi:hypothetical protein
MDVKNMKEDEIRQAVAEVAKSGNRQALAEIITEWLQPQHLSMELMGRFLDTKSLKPGDSQLFKVRKGLHVRTLVPGQIPLRDEITVSERMAYMFDTADIAVNANEMEIQSGELGTIADIKTEMGQKFVDYYVGKLFTALSTVWTAATTSTNFADCSGDLNATSLKAMIDTINQTTGGAKLIVGSRVALTPITTFGSFWTDGTTHAWNNVVLEEIMRTGWLGNYYGVPVLAIEQLHDNFEDWNTLIPEDKVVVIGNKVGQFVTYGPMNTKEYTDMKPTPPVWNYELWQQFSVVILNAMGIGVLAVS